MPSSQSPNKTANNGQEEEIKIGIPIGGNNSSFGDSFQDDQHSMIRLIWIKIPDYFWLVQKLQNEPVLTRKQTNKQIVNNLIG